jgi:glucose-6-phosphate isomerase
VGFDSLSRAADDFDQSLETLFRSDPDRVTRYVIEAAGICMDYSRHWMTDAVRAELTACLEARQFEAKRRALFAGEAVNTTESRAALHMALRAPREADFAVNGHSVMPDVHATLDAVDQFAEAIRDGRRCGHTGRQFRDVIHLGIGGSDLGPQLVYEALHPWADGPRVHFISNVDGSQLSDVLHSLDPETTLCVVVSKSFTTQETMHNAYRVRTWLADALGEAAIGQHVAAVSTNTEAIDAFGIDPEAVFRFWDWVGGRFSLWSAVSLSVVIALGADRFRELLSGAHQMDLHFQHAADADNLPVMMALLSGWYVTGFGLETHAVVPYAERLAILPAYLQQLEMESNGKSVDHAGARLDYDTAPIVWGDAGTNGQHAFFQLLHQGTRVVPLDLWLAANPIGSPQASHQLLMANCLAQLDALSFGTTEGSGHRACPGNRPATLFLFEALTPQVLGALLAAYEHKVFTLSVLWNINPFDQWGVELGKRLCTDVLKQFETPQPDSPTTATARAIQWIQTHQH